MNNFYLTPIEVRSIINDLNKERPFWKYRFHPRNVDALAFKIKESPENIIKSFEIVNKVNDKYLPNIEDILNKLNKLYIFKDNISSLEEFIEELRIFSIDSERFGRVIIGNCDTTSFEEMYNLYKNIGAKKFQELIQNLDNMNSKDLGWVNNGIRVQDKIDIKPIINPIDLEPPAIPKG